MGQKLPLDPPKLEILGILVNVISLKNAVSLVDRWVNSSKQYQIVTPNPEQIVLAQENGEFKKVLNAADLAIPDGGGLVWAMRRKFKIQNEKCKIEIKNSKLRESGIKNQELEAVKRVSGIDLMLALCKKAAKKGWRVMLVGGKEGMAEIAVKKIKNLKFKMKNYNLKFKIVGINGAENIRNEVKAENMEIIGEINEFRPHLLFVAYGAPWQELWIANNLSKLKVKVAMGVGGAFDYLAGRVPRAPAWIRNCGFEWLYRLIGEPWRFPRQFKLLKFVWLVLKGG